jgi:hypothetical protein
MVEYRLDGPPPAGVPLHSEHTDVLFPGIVSSKQRRREILKELEDAGVTTRVRFTHLVVVSCAHFPPFEWLLSFGRIWTKARPQLQSMVPWMCTMPEEVMQSSTFTRTGSQEMHNLR